MCFFIHALRSVGRSNNFPSFEAVMTINGLSRITTKLSCDVKISLISTGDKGTGSAGLPVSCCPHL